MVGRRSTSWRLQPDVLRSPTRRPRLPRPPAEVFAACRHHPVVVVLHLLVRGRTAADWHCRQGECRGGRHCAVTARGAAGAVTLPRQVCVRSDAVLCRPLALVMLLRAATLQAAVRMRVCVGACTVRVQVPAPRLGTAGAPSKRRRSSLQPTHRRVAMLREVCCVYSRTWSAGEKILL